MRTAGWFFLLLASPYVGSCSDSSSGSSGMPGDCQGSLAEVTEGCPKTFDGSSSQLPRCPLGVPMLAVKICSDFVALTFDGGYTRWTCYYDPMTHALVGGDRSTSIRAYCDETSFDIAAGQIAGARCQSMASTKMPCGDRDAGM